jgi:hypothetical protein
MNLESVNQVIEEDQFDGFLTPSNQWPEDLPVEDLTGEVQDLMMRYIYLSQYFTIDINYFTFIQKRINEFLASTLGRR